MNVITGEFDMTRSLQAMGDLLKTITAQTTGLQDRLLRTIAVEKGADPNLGNNLDLEA